MIKNILKLLVVSLSISVAAVAISNAEPTTEITVSAAMSLKNAFEEIGRQYEAKTKGAKITFNFGASGALMAQIKGGAPVDVFASAALKDMDDIDNEGVVLRDTRTNFASNSVVLVAPVSSKVTLTTFEDLKKAEIKKIAVGNPKTVPAGRYADEVLRSLNVFDAVKSKLIFAENVRQVLDYVARGEVDAGIVYSTDAMVKQQEVEIMTTAPDASHKPIIYPIAVVKGAKNEKAAKAFVSFVTSEEGRKILTKYGFKPIKWAK